MTTDLPAPTGTPRRAICFIALGAYAILAGTGSRPVIGPDVHQVLLARHFAKKGYRVVMIVQENAFRNTRVEDIDLIAIPDDRFRSRHLNYLVKLFHLWRGMALARADIYYNAGTMPGIVSVFARIYRVRSVMDISSDAQVDRRVVTRTVTAFSNRRFSFSQAGNRLDLLLADAIILQSRWQQSRLEKNTKKNGTVIPMPFDLPAAPGEQEEGPVRVIWVGSLADVKQPDLFLALPALFPEARFRMIGGDTSHPRYGTRIQDALSAHRNFSSAGIVPFRQIDACFADAHILVNTSLFEGFPQAFIQAWSHAVPVVSLHADPDEVLCGQGLGFHSGSWEQLVQDLRALIEDAGRRTAMGRQGRAYVEAHHDIKNLFHEYLTIIEGLTRECPGS
jgi:glycosyltransferase involved in cell wall biosynthesis